MNIIKPEEIFREQLHNYDKFCMLLCDDVLDKTVYAVALSFEDYKESAAMAKEYFDKNHTHGRLVYYHILKGDSVKCTLESI